MIFQLLMQQGWMSPDMKRIFRYALVMVVCWFATSANAAPMAYSVNSDGLDSATTDSLYAIDLATGIDQRKGKLFTGVSTPIDTEGLAFAPDGTLWGVDDDSLMLFPINKETGGISFTKQVPLTGFSIGGSNDFGMTFSCDNTLYVSTVRTQSLHRVDQSNGSSQVVGSVGALGVNISAIAAYGNPTKLYGLGNGQFQDGSTDSPNLYSIDPGTGVASLIGPLGSQAGAYNQGGLAFDEFGHLYAITDRGIINNSLANLPSQILSIDLNTGKATLLGSTTEVGFESLAIAVPGSCNTDTLIPDPRIPTLSPAGRVLATLMLFLAGVISLRRKFAR